MDEDLLERINTFAQIAEDIAGDAPSDEELEASGDYEWIEFFEEVANVINSYSNILRRKT